MAELAVRLEPLALTASAASVMVLVAAGEHAIRDTELAGFGPRVRPSGRRDWFVRARCRSKHQRATLDATEALDAATARMQARQILDEVALDGLPRRVSQTPSPVFADYVDEFWRRCALPGLCIHDLPHSHASIAIREKTPLATSGRWLGHELPETVAKYAECSDECRGQDLSRGAVSCRQTRQLRNRSIACASAT